MAGAITLSVRPITITMVKIALRMMQNLMASSQSSPSISMSPDPKTADKVSSVTWGNLYTISMGSGVVACWGHESPNAVAVCLPV